MKKYLQHSNRPERLKEDERKDVSKQKFRHNDNRGMVLIAANILCIIVSLGLWIINMKYSISVSYALMSKDGPTSIFIAGKIGQPIWFYTVTALLVGVTVVYYLKKKNNNRCY